MLAALNLSKSQFGWVNQATSHIFGQTSSQKSEILQILDGELYQILHNPSLPDRLGCRKGRLQHGTPSAATVGAPWWVGISPAKR